MGVLIQIRDVDVPPAPSTPRSSPALAEGLDADLVTRDARLAAAVAGFTPVRLV